MTGMTPERLDLIRDRIDHTGYAQWKNVTSELLDEVDRLRAGIEALTEDLHVLAHTTRCTGAMCDGCQAGRIEYRARTLLNPTEGDQS